MRRVEGFLIGRPIAGSHQDVTLLALGLDSLDVLLVVMAIEAQVPGSWIPLENRTSETITIGEVYRLYATAWERSYDASHQQL